MRIRCESLDDFLANLDGTTVHRNTIHVNRTKRAINQDKATLEVTFQASAVLTFQDETEALLECGINCGINRVTANGSTAGTDMQESLYAQLSEYCQARELTIKPGMIDM